MAYENRDYTHLSENEKQKIELIAQAIRNKAYGIDVRESIALAIEWVNREYKLTIENNILTLKEFENAKSKVSALELDMDEFIKRYSEQIAGNTSLDETIDARVDATGVSHTTLKDRLDKEQQEVTEQLVEKTDESIFIGGKRKGTTYGLNNEDAIYSWWTSNALRYDGVRDKAYLGVVDRLGRQGLMSYNYDIDKYERVIFSDYESDDHNAPAVAMLDNDTIISFFTRHSSDNKVRWRTTKKRETIDDFDIQEYEYEVEGLTTYCQLFKFGNQLKVILRVQTPTSNKFIMLTYSSVSNRIIDEQVLFESTTQAYVRFEANRNIPTQLRGFVYQHPIYGSDNNIYYMQVDLANNTILTTGDTGSYQIADLTNETTLPVTFDRMGVAYQAGEKTRLLDVPNSASASFAFVKFTSATDGEYWIGKRVGLTWEHYKITDSGIPFEEPAGANFYFGGVALLHNNPNIAYVSRESAGTWYMEKWRSNDNGETWKLEKEIDKSSTKKLIRPVCLIGGDEDHAGFYQKGMFTTYSNYLTDIFSLNQGGKERELTLLNNWTGNLKLIKEGNKVTISGVINVGSTAKGTAVTAIPSDFLPISTIPLMAYNATKELSQLGLYISPAQTTQAMVMKEPMSSAVTAGDALHIHAVYEV